MNKKMRNGSRIKYVKCNDVMPGMYICTVRRNVTVCVMLLFYDGALFVDTNGFWVNEVLTWQSTQDYINQKMINDGGMA